MAKLSREDRKKTGAFRQFEYDAMSSAVTTLCTRVVSYHKAELTCNDIKGLFIAPAHHDLVHDTVKVIGLEPGDLFVTKQNIYGVGYVNITVRLKHKDRGFVFPKYMGQKVYDAPEVEEIITRWVLRRMEIGQAFALADAVLKALHTRCDNPETVRFYWPTIIGLASTAGIDLADKVRDFKVPKNMPAIPLELRTAMAETTTTIAKAMMMMPTNHPLWGLSQEVKLEIHKPYPTQPIPWGNGLPLEAL